MLTIVSALFFAPGVIPAFHELAAIERDRLFICANAPIKVTFAAGGPARRNQLIELFRVDAIRELRIELIVAIAIDDEIFLVGVVSVLSFPNFRDRRMKVLFY